MTNRLDGKVAVITGAASGIGAVTARRFVAEGCRVILGDIQTQEGQELADSLGGCRTVLSLQRYQRKECFDTR